MIFALLSKSRLPTPDEVKTILLTVIYLAAMAVVAFISGGLFGWWAMGKVIG